MKQKTRLIAHRYLLTIINLSDTSCDQLKYIFKYFGLNRISDVSYFPFGVIVTQDKTFNKKMVTTTVANQARIFMALEM